MKKVFILFLLFSMIGCSQWRLRNPENNLDMANLETIPLDIFDLKTIRQIYGMPDIVDFKNNVVVYISEYIYEAPFPFNIGEEPEKFMIYYLVLHTDSSQTKYLRANLYKELFEKQEKLKIVTGYDKDGNPIWGDSMFPLERPRTVRKSYHDIMIYCHKVK